MLIKDEEAYEKIMKMENDLADKADKEKASAEK